MRGIHRWTWSFDVFFDLRLNKWLKKQLRRRWFEMPSHSLWHHCNVTRYPDCSLELMCQKSLKCIYPSTGSFESELTRWNGNLEPQWQHNTVFNPLWLKLVYWMNYRPLQWYRWCCDQWSIISEESSFYFVPGIQYLSITMHGSVMDIYVISVLQCWSPFLLTCFCWD